MPNTELEKEIRNIYKERNTKLVTPQVQTKTSRGWSRHIFWLLGAILASVMTAAVFVTWYLPSLLYQPVNVNKITEVDTFTAGSILEKIAPATVAIFESRNIRKDLPIWQQSYLNSSLLGQGVVLSSDGWIVTTSQVVENSRGDYLVSTYDGALRPAKTIIFDPATNFVFIKIDAANLVAAAFVRPNDLNFSEGVGVVAVLPQSTRRAVAPRFLSGSSSAGLSATSADLVKSSEFISDLLILDQSMPEGYLGAPVAASSGKVIGLGAVADDELLYVYPLSVLDKIITDVFTSNKITRPVMGVNYFSLASSLPFVENKSDWPSAGALLTKANASRLAVKANSPAAKAGLKENDVITAVAGERVNDALSLSYLLSQYSPGTKLTLVVWRQGKESQVEITLDEVVSEAVIKE